MKINGIECFGKVTSGRCGVAQQSFDVRVMYQKSGTINMRIKKADILLSKTCMLGFKDDRMYFIPTDVMDCMTFHEVDGKWYLRTRNAEIIKRLQGFEGCYTAHYDKSIKAWYIVLTNEEDN
jgi:hypothetical protein